MNFAALFFLFLAVIMIVIGINGTHAQVWSIITGKSGTVSNTGSSSSSGYNPVWLSNVMSTAQSGSYVL